MENLENKYCSDCKWHRLPFLDKIVGIKKYALCANPSIMRKPGDAFVDRSIGPEFQYCSIVREYKECGIEGKLWERKKKG